MSRHNQLWIGPWAEWVLPLVEVKTDYCAGHADKITGVQKYCPVCGTAATSRYSTYQDIAANVEPDRLIDDALSRANTNHYDAVTIGGKPYGVVRLIPNEHRPGFVHRDTDGEFALEVDVAVAFAEKLWLLRAFEAELATLARVYGSQPTIKWGVVKWSS